MSPAANELLNAFDELPEDERREVAVGVLKRVLNEAKGVLTDEALLGAAEELFLELDAREAADGDS